MSSLWRTVLQDETSNLNLLPTSKHLFSGPFAKFLYMICIFLLWFIHNSMWRKILPQSTTLKQYVSPTDVCPEVPWSYTIAGVARSDVGGVDNPISCEGLNTMAVGSSTTGNMWSTASSFSCQLFSENDTSLTSVAYVINVYKVQNCLKH